MPNNSKPNYQTLKSMSKDAREKMYMELAYLVMPTSDLPANKKIPFWKRVYGCVTWGDARELMDLVAMVSNESLK